MALRRVGRAMLIDDDVLTAYADFAKGKAKREKVDIVRRVSRSQPIRAGMAKLKRIPPPPSYPLRWKSDKQRRYVMAKLREEGNIPYGRTGQYVEAWGIEINGDQIEAVNDSGIYDYVQGDQQQPFHADTGWAYAPPIFDEMSEQATDIAIDQWVYLTDRIGR